jgi:hypothetical protein
MITLLVIGCILSYLIIAAWTFGYCAGLDGRGEKEPHYSDHKGLGWYHDEACAWVPAIFWPAALVYFLIVKPLAYLGYRKGGKTLQVRQVRAELHQKLRVEIEKAERELEEEFDSHRITRSNEAA